MQLENRPDHDLQACDLNPEEQMQEVQPFNDCTPDMVKDKDRWQAPTVSHFFCSPEPSALIHATPDSYS